MANQRTSRTDGEVRGDASRATAGRTRTRKARSGQVAERSKAMKAVEVQGERSRSASGTVTMQARVDAEFARELQADAAVLGLPSGSELVREGLRLVHKQAREVAMAASYDEFYDGHPSPSSDVAEALWRE